MWKYTILFFYLLLRINLFLERGREGEREGEKHQCLDASPAPSTRDLVCNPGMCPDWESNQRPFGLQAGAQSTEPHQPGLKIYCSVEVKMKFHILSLNKNYAQLCWDIHYTSVPSNSFCVLTQQCHYHHYLISEYFHYL